MRATQNAEGRRGAMLWDGRRIYPVDILSCYLGSNLCTPLIKGCANTIIWLCIKEKLETLSNINNKRETNLRWPLSSSVSVSVAGTEGAWLLLRIGITPSRGAELKENGLDTF
jgi:hypothetical protein